MPSASDSVATVANSGLRRSPRMARRKSPVEAVMGTWTVCGAEGLSRIADVRSAAMAIRSVRDEISCRRGPRGSSRRARAPVEKSEDLVLRARATDLAGRTQPERAEWNRLGYGNNAIQQVPIRVR